MTLPYLISSLLILTILIPKYKKMLIKYGEAAAALHVIAV